MGVELEQFPIMTYQDAMRLYGSDKPDLQVKLEFTRNDRRHDRCRLQVFSGAANMKGGRVVALEVCPGGSVEAAASAGVNRCLYRVRPRSMAPKGIGLYPCQ